MRILAHLKCSVCGDTWYRDMDDMEITAYMIEHPGIDLSKVTDIDLGEVLCDGCEDYMDDETEAQAQDDPWSVYYNPVKMNWSPMKKNSLKSVLKTQQLTGHGKNTIEI